MSVACIEVVIDMLFGSCCRNLKQALVLVAMIMREVVTTDVGSRKAQFTTNENMYLPYLKGEIFVAVSMMQCSHKCLASSAPCVGANFNTFQLNGRHHCYIVHTINSTGKMESRTGWVFMERNLMVGACVKLIKTSKYSEIVFYWGKRDGTCR